jgi:streptomycin 6-kinase
MTRLRVPSLLAEYLADDPDPARQQWLDRLPGVVAGLADRWDLQVGEPFEPGGQCSWVAPARTAAGERLVLKVGWVHPEAAYEAAGLEFWAGHGAVRLHAHLRLADSAALLLERCEPGTALTSVAEPDRDEVVCRVLRKLWREPPARLGFPALQAMCDDWAARYEAEPSRPDLSRPQTGRPGLDPGIARAGLALLRELPGTAGRQVLLATDLHAENILAARREPWLAIDPKPHVGDPAYDPLQYMLNCGRLLTDPAGLARRLAGLLDLDRRRLLLWLFARCVQESPGRPDLADVATRLAP